ncbi:hypothetical protein CHUAL_003222 [Chamberlinius hualienensis]
MNTKISEYCQMKKCIPKREDSGLKREICGEDAEPTTSKFVKCDTVSSSSAYEVMLPPKTPSVGNKLDYRRRKTLMQSSPDLSTQKEIFWNTVSPDCALRLKPRVLDESQIQEDVATTISTYLPTDSKPKLKESGILDTWLNRTETVSIHQPTTPKSTRENYHSRSRVAKQKQTLSALKLFFEDASKPCVNERTTTSDSNAVQEHESSLLLNDSVWEEDELFNDTDFLAATQQLEVNYIETKTSPTKPKAVTATNKCAGLRDSVEFKRIDKSSTSVKLKMEVESNITSIGRNSNPVISSASSDELTVNPTVTSGAGDKVNNDEDEIERIMCTIDCPANDSDVYNVATQVINWAEPDITKTNEFDTSFNIDSDDSFGADFDV